MEGEQLTLFGQYEAVKPVKRVSRDEKFNDYTTFVDKFETKKTTDDCFTPEPVYQAVLDFVKTLTPLEGRAVVRPFYPGGDYENFTYPEGCIVVDNPPFSILTKICRFFTLHSIPFFLFGPSLTLFTAPDCDLTYIIADVNVTYANGAKVRTGFITNIVQDIRIWCCPELKDAVEKAQEKPSKRKKLFLYPDNIVTAATLQYITAHHVELRIPKAGCEFIRDSDEAKRLGRCLYGGGFLLSEKAAAEKAAAEKAAAAKAATEKAAADRLSLSQRELLIVEKLNKRY